MVDEPRAEVDLRLLLSSREEKFSSVTRDEVAVFWSYETMPVFKKKKYERVDDH